MQKFYDKTNSQHGYTVFPEEVAKTIFQTISIEKMVAVITMHLIC